MDEIVCSDALEYFRAQKRHSANCIITSPPYYNQRDYGKDGQLGLEATPGEFVDRMVAIFREARRVLRPDGTLWLNLGDSYNGSGKASGRSNENTSYIQATHKGSMHSKRTMVKGLKTKDLIGIPWRVALALQEDGWYLRSDIPWIKTNPMPESVTDRPSKGHEYWFLFSKSGNPLFWVHKDRPYAACFEQQREKPEQEYAWVDTFTGERVDTEPKNWKTEKVNGQKRWRKINLWRGCDYYYDIDAVRRPHQAVSLKRAMRGSSTVNKYNTVGYFPEEKAKPPSIYEERVFRGYDNMQQLIEAGATKLNPAGRNGRTTDIYIDSIDAEIEALQQRLDYLRSVRENDGAYTQGDNIKALMVATKGFKGGHYATYSVDLITPLLLAGCPPDGLVIDPFMGSGTTALAAIKHGRHYSGCDINPGNVELARKRIAEFDPFESTGEQLSLFGT